MPSSQSSQRKSFYRPTVDQEFEDHIETSSAFMSFPTTMNLSQSLICTGGKNAGINAAKAAMDLNALNRLYRRTSKDLSRRKRKGENSQSKSNIVSHFFHELKKEQIQNEECQQLFSEERPLSELFEERSFRAYDGIGSIPAAAFHLTEDGGESEIHGLNLII